MRKLLVSAFATVAVLVAACADDDKGAATDDARSAFAQQYCEISGPPCCPSRGDTYDASLCRTYVSLGGTSRRVSFDQAAGDACLAALRNAQKQPSFCYDFGGDAVRKACAAAFASPGGPTKKLGEACLVDEDCALDPSGDVSCRFLGVTSMEGKCTVFPRGKESDPCIGDKFVDVGLSALAEGGATTVCWEADGLFCALDAGRTAHTCRKRAALDAPCESRDSCVSGAFCGDDLTCAPYRAVGDSCSLSRPCTKDAFCRAATGTCAPLALAGGVCEHDEDCGLIHSCTGGKCVHSTLGLGLFVCAAQ